MIAGIAFSVFLVVLCYNSKYTQPERKSAEMSDIGFVAGRKRKEVESRNEIWIAERARENGEGRHV
jgi:hypothetical protein